MNVYDLNEFTTTNILLYQQEDPLLVFYSLLKDNLYDAIIVYQIYKWNYIYCTNISFLKWIKEKSICIELQEDSKKELIINGDKEILDYIKPNDYVYFILLSTPNFLTYIIKHFNITIDSSHFIKLIHEKKDLYEIFLILLSVIDIKENIIVNIIFYLCKFNQIELIKHLLSLYPLILKKYNSYLYLYFFNSITYNNLELTIYFLSIEPKLIKNIESILIDLFIKRCTKILQLLYTLNKTLFSKINHNYIFKKIASNTIIDETFLHWYLSHFTDKIDTLIYEESIKLFKLNGFIIDPIISDDYFIHACSNNYLHIVKKYNYNYSIIEKGFEISAFLGYLDIVDYLIDFIENNKLYKILHALIIIDTPHIHIVKIIYKSITIYPPKLLHYFCKMGMIEVNQYKDLDEECIYLLSKHGHFSIFYYIQPNYDISNAFIYSCETGKGLFIAKWLYYNNVISKNTIIRAFYNSYDIHTLKWLYNIESIPITENNNAYFIERCIHNELDIVMWLCELYPHYSYSIVNGVICYNIDLLKIYKKEPLELLECCICLEMKSDSISLCNHSFCYVCINKWYKQKNSCPICRIQLDKVYYFKY